MKYLLSIIIISLLLSSCTRSSLKAPCPDFGAHCYQQPINAWNYRNATVF